MRKIEWGCILVKFCDQKISWRPAVEASALLEWKKKKKEEKKEKEKEKKGKQRKGRKKKEEDLG